MVEERVAGEGLSGQKDGHPTGQRGMPPTKQVDIWDEGREPADPTSILFWGGCLPSVSSALGSNSRKVTRVQGAGPGEEPKLWNWGWSVGCGLETLKPCGHWGREGSSSAPPFSPALPPNRLNGG